MQIAILTVSSLACIFAGGAFAVSMKTALELKKAKDAVDEKLAGVESKFETNKQVVRDALGKLEF